MPPAFATPAVLLRRRGATHRAAVLSKRHHPAPILAPPCPTPARQPTRANPVVATFTEPSSTPVPPEVNGSPNPQAPPPDQVDLDQKRRDVTRLLALFARLATPYWRSDKSARRDLAALLALTFLQSGVSVAFSYISRDFWTALNTKDISLFYHQAQLFVGALAVATPIVVYYQFLRDTVSLRWRDWITRRILAQYCARRNFYNLEIFSDVDNPDQRIAQDLAAFTTESITFALTILVSAVDLVCFSFILFSIYPALFGVLVAYAGVGTVATAVIGKQLISLNYTQLVREADLRYGLVRMRENAESIAFFDGAKSEQAELTRRLSAAVDNMADVIGLRRRLAFLQTGYKYAVQILPAVCVAPRYFAGEIQLGSVTQSFSAFSHILGDLSLVVNRFDALSHFGAGIDRLAQFVEALEADVASESREFNAVAAERNGKETTSYAGSTTAMNGTHVEKEVIERRVGANGQLRVEGLSVVTPGGPSAQGRQLVRDLTLMLRKGERLLLAGPSGTGKSSVLRAVAGLWSEGQGTVEAPSSDDMFFLPQKPYCTLGSLRANLLYPRDQESMANEGSDKQVTDSALLDVLQRVDLGDLPGRMGGLDAIADWADILSLGEQQRLQFARLLLNPCDMVVIDEGSSALSVSAEGHLYGLLMELGATVVSVGHRPSLLAYHDRILRLSAGGKWEVEQINESRKAQPVAQVM